MTPRERDTGGLAFAGLLLFVVVVYANPGNWFNGLEEVGFAKIAASLALAALGGSWLLYNRPLRLGGAPGAALLSLFVLVGLSATWSYWPKYSVDTFLDGLKYLAIFYVVVNVIDREHRLGLAVAVLALASVIPAVGCIVSWSRGEHLVDGDRAAWIGIFANPNDLAYHLVVGIAMMLAARDAAVPRWKKLSYLALLVPMGVALLLTQSRGGMIAAGIVLGLWALRAVRHAPTLIGVAVAVGCVLYLSPGDPWKHREESSMSYGEDMSARGRFDAWRTGLAIAAERPLTGVGAGAFVIAWPDFAPGDAGPARTAHNTFIQIIAELGVPALLLFLGALVAGLVSGSRATRARPLMPYGRGVQCALAGFAVCSVSGGLAFSWPFYLVLGLAVAAARVARPEPVAVAPRRALAAMGS
jgi:O-antigen ligase